MAIIHDSGIASLSEYLALKDTVAAGPGQGSPAGVLVREGGFLVPERPKACRACGAAGSLWVKGYYTRKAVEGDRQEEILVPRYECSLCWVVISILFAFLVPYRQFTIQTLEQATQEYLMSNATYRSVAGELAGVVDDTHRPNHSQVWRWVNDFALKSARFLMTVLQRACVDAGKELSLTGVSQHVCPNSKKAHTAPKARALNCAVRVLAMAQHLLETSTELLQPLQAYFASFVQNPLSIFTGRGVRLLSPHNLHHAIN